MLVPYAAFDTGGAWSPGPLRLKSPRLQGMYRFLVIALGMLSGCYAEVPLGTLEPQAGTRIVAELTGYGSDTLAGAVGPGVTTLRGYVVSADNTDVTLSVTSVSSRFGPDQSWRGEQVRVPLRVVQNVQLRKFSLGRSLLLGAAFLGGSVVAWEAFKGESPAARCRAWRRWGAEVGARSICRRVEHAARGLPQLRSA